MDKLKMQTPNITEQNIEQIAKLFPHVMTETQDENGKTKKAIDFDLLKQSLSAVLVEDADERYRLDWPGKKAALLKANTPITKTLRPCREDSVNFDTTENVYIEGDNFEVLKILQESYLGKIKMIYIDPPYNTGNDFIYKDNFTAKKADYEEELGTTDEDDNKLFRNTDTNGRFHSDWLSMMYERLVVARDLLKDEGMVFIQIDDNEIHNLRAVCDEVFGSENFINLICIQMSFLSGVKMSHVDKKLPKVKEFILAYGKDKSNINVKPIFQPSTWDDTLSRYTQMVINKNEKLENWKVVTVKEAARLKGVDVKNKQLFDKFLIENNSNIFRTARNRSLKVTGLRNVFSKIVTQTGLDKIIFNDEEVLFASNKVMKIDGSSVPVNPLGDLWTDIGINNLHNEGGVDFRNGKKPIKLLKRIVSLSCDKKDLILDFFSGSATTAHAVMQLNAEDNGNRKFIMVQLPEPCDEKSEAYKAGYKTIAEIGKERIRRAAKMINDELIIMNEKNNSSSNIHNSQLDTGFRVYKTDSTNMKEVYYHPEQLRQSELPDLESNIKEDRTPDDLLTQVILDLGLELNLPIEQKDMHGNKVFIVQTNALVACFDDNINIKIIDEIAQLKPFKVVFKDASFAASKDRINLEERFKRLSPETLITVI